MYTFNTLQLSRALYLVSLRGSGYVPVGCRGCDSSGHFRNVTLRCPLALASRLRLGGYGLTLASGLRWSVSVSSRFLSRWFVWLLVMTIHANQNVSKLVR